jgi:hypothetical protein
MRHTSVLLAGFIFAALGRSAPAEACGGCFQPPAVDSVVTGHRMAFAVSANRTVLWDQIKYSGNPGDFGWVLPVAPGATLELSSDAWFEVLETATSTRINPPVLKCATNNNDSGFLNCGSSVDSASASPEGFAVGGGPQVTVLRDQSLGPFETVTLRSQDSGALRDWLTSHGYAIGQDIDPIIDAYIGEGMDFIALRLNGSAPMQPVRVVTPNGKAVLPLRMVAAGTGDQVDIVLYTIGERRLGLLDLTETTLDLSALSFDFASSQTNYDSVRADALSENLGASFLTTFAAKHPFDRIFSRTLTTSNGQRSSNTLAQLYFDQGFEDATQIETGCSLAQTGLTGDELVADATDAAKFSCGDKLTDISAAVIGMHPSRMWLTRLEMNLPHEVLSMDCRMDDQVKQKEVSSDLTAVRAKNPFCDQPLFESRIARKRTSPGYAAAWTLLGIAVVGLARRARRRR